MSNLDIYDLTNVAPWNTSPLSHTDIKRLRAGKVGAQVINFPKHDTLSIPSSAIYQLISIDSQFWSAYVGCSIQYKDAVQKTWGQIDVVHRMVEANPSVFEFVTTAQGKILCYI